MNHDLRRARYADGIYAVNACVDTAQSLSQSPAVCRPPSQNSFVISLPICTRRAARRHRGASSIVSRDVTRIPLGQFRLRTCHSSFRNGLRVDARVGQRRNSGSQQRNLKPRFLPTSPARWRLIQVLGSSLGECKQPSTDSSCRLVFQDMAGLVATPYLETLVRPVRPASERNIRSDGRAQV